MSGDLIVNSCPPRAPHAFTELTDACRLLPISWKDQQGRRESPWGPEPGEWCVWGMVCAPLRGDGSVLGGRAGSPQSLLRGWPAAGVTCSQCASAPPPHACLVHTVPEGRPGWRGPFHVWARRMPLCQAQRRERSRGPGFQAVPSWEGGAPWPHSGGKWRQPTPGGLASPMADFLYPPATSGCPGAARFNCTSKGTLYLHLQMMAALTLWWDSCPQAWGFTRRAH